MMKKELTLLTLLGLFCLTVQAQWQPAGENLKTAWGEQLTSNEVLPEYPRPQLERSEWLNMNGLWEYAVTPKGGVEPATFEGNILVPFAIESSLSGVQKKVGERNELWYKRFFSVPRKWRKNKILLNFGAVDWQADVFINDVLIGTHKGGYTPFSFDITPFLSSKKEQKIVVRVWDPSDRGFQPLGKQTLNPAGCFYTTVTGIWQTVWIEPVGKNSIAKIKAIPNIDSNSLAVTVTTQQQTQTDVVEILLLDKGTVVAKAKGVAGKELRLAVDQPNLWSPENPYLYDLQLSLFSHGKKVDQVKSYTAFRLISKKRDQHGVLRMQLNHKDYFHFGLLDQGWWPDGLYTAPTDEALAFDIKKTKAWGFNMIRKHVKVEPARWYYHCDKEGVLVWQDMPSAERGNQWSRQWGGGTDAPRTKESKENFYKEWKEIMDVCISHPSVVVWVPFNEAWGQFDTEKVVKWTAEQDPSRLINPASGGNFRQCGDILDLHNYPQPAMFLYSSAYVNVLGEYGGIGFPVKGHLWTKKKSWGYVKFNSKEKVTAEYVKYAKLLKQFKKRGFSAAVYTQTTDVEGEVNGLMTYDRKVMKVDEKKIRKINLEVIGE